MGLFSSKISRSAMANSAEIQQFIKDAISQEKVVVFSKSYCPYCKLAKDVSILQVIIYLFFKNFRYLVKKIEGLFVFTSEYIKVFTQVGILLKINFLILSRYPNYCIWIYFQVFNKVKQPIKVYELDERDDGSAIQENLAQITGFRTVSYFPNRYWSKKSQQSCYSLQITSIMMSLLWCNLSTKQSLLYSR